MTITIIGLGPADGRYLTREAWEKLSSGDTVYLRTSHHPCVADLPAHLNQVSFDALYETAASFAEVYEGITTRIISLGKAAFHGGWKVLYAVPGHPLVGESTVTSILAAAKEEGLPVELVAGMSFVEPTLSTLGIDGLEGLQLFDAIEIARYNHPPLNSDVPILLGQVYNRLLAGELKMALSAIFPDEHQVMLVHGAGTVNQIKEEVPLYAIDRSEHLAHLTSLYVPPLPVASSLPALAETVAYLRGPDGCPWDQEQTRQSVRNGFLEEMAEALDAIDADDPDALCEELGDVLYHLVMQAQIAHEQEEFRLGDVIAGIEQKLKRRHPHVWGDWVVANSAEVVENWEALKVREKDGDEPAASILDNVPSSLPALARAHKIQDRVRRVGFDWPAVEGVISKVNEELAELHAEKSGERQQQELGDVLFALVNWARWLNIDAEIALREANRRFEERFRRLEIIAGQRNLELAGLDLTALDGLWEEAKALLAGLGEDKEIPGRPMIDAELKEGK